MDDTMQSYIKKVFIKHDLAFSFLCAYIEYIHAIDDLVDEPKDLTIIRKVTELASRVFNHDYWLKYRPNLIITERLAHNEYFDSVSWELSGVDWKIRDSKVMNQCGYNMLFAIILIEFGENELSNFSNTFRQYSHTNQGHDKL